VVIRGMQGLVTCDNTRYILNQCQCNTLIATFVNSKLYYDLVAMIPNKYIVAVSCNFVCVFAPVKYELVKHVSTFTHWIPSIC